MIRVLLLTLLLTPMLAAQTTTWTGAVNNRWDNPGNWSDGVPMAHTDALIASAPPTQPNILNMSVLVNNLVIEAGAVLTMVPDTQDAALHANGHIQIFGTITIDEGDRSAQVNSVGGVTIHSSGVLALMEPSSVVECGGDFTNSGTFQSVPGTRVVMYAIAEDAGTHVAKIQANVDTDFYELAIDKNVPFGEVTVVGNIHVIGDPMGMIPSAGVLVVTNGVLQIDAGSMVDCEMFRSRETGEEGNNPPTLKMDFADTKLATRYMRIGKFLHEDISAGIIEINGEEGLLYLGSEGNRWQPQAGVILMSCESGAIQAASVHTTRLNDLTLSVSPPIQQMITHTSGPLRVSGKLLIDTGSSLESIGAPALLQVMHAATVHGFLKSHGLHLGGLIGAFVTVDGDGSVEAGLLRTLDDSDVTFEVDVVIMNGVQIFPGSSLDASTVTIEFSPSIATGHIDNRGSVTFGNLVSTRPGKEMFFRGNPEAQVNVVGDLVLKGKVNEPMELKLYTGGTTNPPTGVPWYINATGGRDIRHVQVTGSVAITPIVALESIDGGDNTNWFFFDTESLQVSLNGPYTPSSVLSDSQGPDANGELLLDITLMDAAQGDWVIDAMTFEADGTVEASTAFSEISLWEKIGDDEVELVTAFGGFDNNEITLHLTGDDRLVAPHSFRRFLLRGKLAGTASMGATFGVRLLEIHVDEGPDGADVAGVPTDFSNALIIETSLLTVQLGANSPAASMWASGQQRNLAVLQLDLSAEFHDVAVDAITFTLGGTEAWPQSLLADGFEVWLDDGDGVFDPGADQQLFAGSVIGDTITVPLGGLNIPEGDVVGLWVVANFTATVGEGASEPIMFNAGVADPADISLGGPGEVFFGIPGPTSENIGFVEFRVDSFAPLSGPFQGGTAITMTGSGFVAPVTVLVGGNTATGTANILGAGTEVTGLLIPSGEGQGNAIIIRSAGGQLELTLAETFTYGSGGLTPGGGAAAGGGGCSTGSLPVWPAAVVLLGVLLLRGRLVRRAN